MQQQRVNVEVRRLAPFLTAMALLASLSLAGCGKKDEGGADASAPPPADAGKAPEAGKPADEAKPAGKDKATEPTSATTGGEVIQFKGAGLKFETPTGWKSEITDDVVTVKAPDGDIEVNAWVEKKEDLKQAVSSAAEDLDKLMKEAKVDGDTKEKEVNGLKVVYINGTGKDKEDGSPVAWDLAVVAAEHPVMFVTYGSAAAVTKQKDLVDGIRASISKLGG